MGPLTMGLDSVEFVLEIEEEFSITISDEDAEKLGIVGDIASYIVKESFAQANLSVSYETALTKITDMLANNYGVPREKIRPNAHVVKDLHLD